MTVIAGEASPYAVSVTVIGAAEIAVCPPPMLWLRRSSDSATVVRPGLIAVRPTVKSPLWPGARLSSPDPVAGCGVAPNPPTRVSPPCSRGLVTVTVALETCPTWTLPKSMLVCENVGVTRASTGADARASLTKVPPWPSEATVRP